METNFLLFDIDGVLINPIGYRKAVYDTTRHFLDILGFSKISINDEIISTFESMGITSEWDMIPLYILSILEQVLKQNNRDQGFENSMDCYRFFSRINVHPAQDEIIEQIQFLNEYLQDGYSVCESILLRKFQNEKQEIFNFGRDKLPWLIDNWLKESRNIQKSEILQYFQNLSLGSNLFQQITGLNPFLESEPYLTKYDSPMITIDHRNKIQKLRSKNIIFPAIITARPSSFPIGATTHPSQLNFPEAELALKCLGLENIPCVGFGALEYLGITKNQSGDQFVKPSPVHALTAILCSIGMDLRDALDCSYNYIVLGRPSEIVNHFFQLNSPINICIFEDSPIGIQSLKKLCRLLESDGLEVKMIPFGISTHQNKITTLKNENAIIFPTINEAFSACVDLLKI